MDAQLKNKLIQSASKMPCVACGNREHVYTEIDKQEQIHNKAITIPNVPVMRCTTCNSISYFPFSYSYVDAYLHR